MNNNKIKNSPNMELNHPKSMESGENKELVKNPSTVENKTIVQDLSFENRMRNQSRERLSIYQQDYMHPLRLNLPIRESHSDGGWYYYIKRRNDGKQSVYKLKHNINYNLDMEMSDCEPASPDNKGKYYQYNINQEPLLN